MNLLNDKCICMAECSRCGYGGVKILSISLPCAFTPRCSKTAAHIANRKNDMTTRVPAIVFTGTTTCIMFLVCAVALFMYRFFLPLSSYGHLVSTDFVAISHDALILGGISVRGLF